MIDSSKLLSRVTSNRNLISRKVLVDLTIVKRDAVKVDNLLKERLVLTKVREGILRQQRENEMRREREQQLEEKRDDESANVDPKKKNQPKSLLGNIIKFVLGGFLNVIGRLTFGIFPRLPFLLKTIVRFTKFFGTIIRGTFNIARVLIKIAPKIIKVAGGFGTKIFFAISKVVGVIAASTTGFIANIIGTLTAPLSGALARKGASRVTDSVVQERAVRTKAPNIDPKATVDVGGKRTVEKKFAKLTEDELAEELAKRRAKAQQPLEMAGSKFGTTDVLQQQKRETIIKKQRKIQKRNFLKKGFKSLEAEKLAEEKLLRKLLKGKGKFSQGQFFKLPDVNFQKDMAKVADILQMEAFRKANIIEGLGDMSDVELRNMGFDADEIRSNLGVKAGKDVGADALLDAVNNPKNTVKASKIVGKKGLSKLLFNIGGEALEQSVKQSIKASIGVVPIIGDLIGVLLDVFLFGEPVGRAVFKGIGSFALGALLGGVGTALGGPVGTLIGSIIGGIGGDILGGIAYDLFFGRKPQAGGYSTVTGGGKEYLKGVSKARGIQNLNEGGLVARKSRNKKNSGIDPRILELYPELDPMKPSDYIKLKRKTLPVDLALRSQAFYERNQVGREIMIPIPIPINNNKNQSGGGNIVIHSKNAQKANSFSQLYRRG
jgi:hypothetical protein